MIEIIMPAMEMAQDTGTLLQWLKQEGEFVQKGEPLFQVETDKVSVDIEATGSGYLANVAAQPGDKIPVGQVIAQLVPQPVPAQAQDATVETSTSESVSREVAISPLARLLAQELEIDPAQIPARGRRIEKADVLAFAEARTAKQESTAMPQRLPAATPQARRAARERGIDLTSVQGSGPGGAVRLRDLAGLSAAAAVPTAPAVQPSTPTSARGQEAYTVVPLAGIRKSVADRLQASYQTAPHIALTIQVDMTEAKRLVSAVGETVRAQTGHPLTLTTVIAKLVGSVLLRHPRLNAHLVGAEIREFPSVHMGIAVALPEGLIVPVVHDVTQKGLAAIQGEVSDLSARARAGTLKPNEVRGGTFTISNLGMFEIEQFSAILNPPEVAILSVGTITDTPINANGQIVLRPMMHLTLNADHRAVDGAVAAHFLQDLKRTIASPYQLFV